MTRTLRVMSKPLVDVSEANRTIEFVYFDLGNVLLSFDRSRGNELLSRRWQIEPSAIDAALNDSGLQERYEHGELEAETVVSELANTVGLPDRKTDVIAIELLSDMFTPIDGMEAVVKAVREHMGRVGLLSNTCRGHIDNILRRHHRDLGDWFDVSVLSYEHGHMKPDPEIYRIAEEACDHPPERILFLDDRRENVRAAQKRGWHAHQCWGGPPAIEVLARYGINPAV